MRILAIGDIVSRPGRKILKQFLPRIKRELQIDICIANGENAATGNGITHKITKELYSYGVDAITMGNHTFAKKQVNEFIDSEECMVRPANYPSELPGKGSIMIYKGNMKVGIINLCGRIYLESKIEVACPFTVADEEIQKLKKYTNVIVVDFHAEATSEKVAMGWYLDGRVSAVFGTHTHVQTADERILPNGTGYITDIGMTGPYNSVLGIDKDVVIEKFITSNSAKFNIGDGDMQLNGIYLEIDENNGKCTKIDRVRRYLK